MSEGIASPVTPERILQFAWGYAPPLIIEAAVRNGLFDQLDRAPQTTTQLAGATETSERGVRILLNVLVGLGLVRKDSDARYSLSEDAAAFLVSSKPGYLGGFYRHMSAHLIPKWLDLAATVKSGIPAATVNEHTEGAAFFQSFVEDIFPTSYPAARALAAELDLASVEEPYRVLDIAAGSGVWGIAMAQSSPHVTVAALDWPEVLPVTKKMVGRFGFADRWEYIEGDLNSVEFGSGYQLATLGHILHSEGEHHSRALLQYTFAALAPGGVIAIAEWLVQPDRSGPVPGLIFAVNMLVNTSDGDTYSFEEIKGWLEEARFVDVRLVEAPGPSPLILATKPAVH